MLIKLNHQPHNTGILHSQTNPYIQEPKRLKVVSYFKKDELLSEKS
jgi:hypothetical protein